MKPFPSEPLSYFLFYIRQYKWYVGIFCLVIILNVILMKLTPYYFSQLIDVLGNYQADKTGVWSAIYVLLFLLFMTDLGSNILRRINFHIVTIIDPNMSVQIIKESTEYVLHHSAGFLTDQQTGKLSARVSQESLHQNIAVIPQDTALFHRTIAENIGYGKPEADRQKMVTAAKKAYAHKFIIQTQNGYDSMVGDRGVKLSGGERQRIAIARAILKKAPILILDEATSALDSESEKYIQNSLKKLMRGKTVIAIAHRLSTLKEMDRIVVMGKGRVIEQGSPAQLLKKKGKYAKLWRTQTQ